ncbi:Histone-lysine N-methyltransferase SETMAR [Araneus ventricosus]|uniref:Histone-lysine N-methyltransferase SETMAR n=1 Tax=Araneus ventricosus TaxID=182803 RepID=A0A4Y2TTP5_ARAVE|nr:Histone-lysine N-methyltransferase SETMAR [Araneus ventricosus]
MELERRNFTSKEPHVAREPQVADSWHKLSDEQKQHQMETCGGFIDACDRNPQFLETIVTGDELWCYQYDPETKRQSMEWCSASSPPKKCRLTKSRTKTLLIAFFDSKGLIHHEFVPAGTTVNAESYEGVFKRLLQRIRRVRTQLYQIGQWKLLHDNARPHIAIRVRQFLATRKVTVLERPPYSPDLALAVFLFPRLKGVLKGIRFSGIAQTSNV